MQQNSPPRKQKLNLRKRFVFAEVPSILPRNLLYYKSDVLFYSIYRFYTLRSVPRTFRICVSPT